MRGAFPLFILHTLRTTLLLPLVCFFFSVSVLKYALTSKDSRTVQGSNSLTEKISKASTGLRGGVSWRVRLRTRIPLVLALRMCGAIPPLPIHAFVASIWTARVGIRERKIQEDRETCQVVSFAIVVITINK